ncbi:replication restart helicase PriA [Riemerella anatipestifer]|uniref:Replication restart protein PriA n=1 Tax=Riemerella anatipestifer RA-CH-1 TaxID=1228997 RepID=J9QZP3_RIEAN|nr:primosomal protein N' [Riemerella anatipestifer]AFR36140.1 Primosomal protein N' (replication factor Y) - superfamily II helicase [Riemerella anatipestifer RA-CH-1]MCO7332791.1 primosomal protein N' [Riemerella anatipestifer]MCO7351681.1 primosomal protein N' [Riemerella anatipestifer]MCU7582291.1 primosomal protein N' [Riemerella anatipestifer]MCW0493387.1 primosomal protein N' [Riemerella anatipestifer]
MLYAQVILPLNLKGTFTYKVPIDLQDKIALGMRVLVPFRGKKIYTGIISDLHQNTPEEFSPKEIYSILDDTPILPLPQLEFWQWLSSYYLCNLGEIYRLAFPSSLKLESETYLKLKPNANIDYELLDANEILLIQALEVQQLVNLSEMEAFIPKKNLIKTINALIDMHYIEIDEKVAEKYKVKEVAYVKIKEELLGNQSLAEVISSLNRAEKQKELFLLILSKQTTSPEVPIKKSILFEEGNFAHAQMKALIDKDLVDEYYLQHDRLETYNGDIEDLEPLTETQNNTFKAIEQSFAQNQKVLLHGVTSSGKTHIYIHLIEQLIKENKNTLLLLPEIALTKQIIRRLEKKYGDLIGFYHQKLTDFERVEVWRKVKLNKIKVLIGTRNALFLPYQNLDLVIVDEEHDSAYKPREASPYFNAKDAAQILAHHYKAHLLLGSATPSLESYYAAQKGKLKYLYLGERYGNVDLPDFEIINIKEEQETKTINGNFSAALIQKIQENLEKNKQIIILHNRRGYANVVECEACGYVTYCSNCDVVMTYHKSSNEMKCHYCGQRASKPNQCPRCQSQQLNTKGVGVEQVAEEVKRLFPEAEVDRMDIDSMRKKFAYEKLYEKIENRETNIIVGTQMISKGLDFDHIDLVAIPKADALLYVQDFRAEEKAYQLITQVSGRAGRTSGKGKIIIQTYNPTHPLFSLIKHNSTQEIYEHFLNDRKKFLYPPFTKVVLLEIKHSKEGKADRASQFLGSILRKYLPLDCVLGPEKAPIAKLKNKYQFQILLKLPRNNKYFTFKEYISQSLDEFREISAYQSVKIELFVDF